jgi:hypothetical protein
LTVDSVLQMIRMGYEPSYLTLTGILEATVSGAVAINGIQITVDENGVLTGYSYTSGSTNLVIPDSVKSIGLDAFKNFEDLTAVSIPNSVTSIGSSAFQNCVKLTAVSIPSSVTSIGDLAFKGCSLLKNITLQRVNNQSQELTILNKNCFSDTGITEQIILNIYKMGYTRYDLITSGIPNNIVDQVISDVDDIVNITIYYYFSI